GDPPQDEQRDDEPAELLLGVDGAKGHQLQCGPSCSCPVVLVPIGGPCTTCFVSTTITPPSTVTPNRSRPRGAGPPFFSPTRLYFDPWQPHSNHCEVGQLGTRQPRGGDFWYRAISPASMPASSEGE